MTTTTKTALIRIDTPNYGWIVSLHRTTEAASAAYDRKAAAVTRKHRDALPQLMYRVVELSTGSAKVGDRVRI